jgi:F-type H+-transporting ATPase subunit delta
VVRDDLTLGCRYARAILDLAAEIGGTEATGEELAELARAAFADRRAVAFWRSHNVPIDEKQNLLQDVLEELDASTLVRNAANLLLERRRFHLLPLVVKGYHQLALEASGRMDATVTSAFELDEAAQEKLRQGLSQLTGKTVVLKTQTDPELIGGATVRIGNLVIDGSVRGRLRAFERTLGQPQR